MSLRVVALQATLLSIVLGVAEMTFAAPAVEEILITAQKREESLMDVPQSVQAFDTSFIENNNVRDLVDAVNFVPGASASFSGGAGSQLYNLRGTGAQGRIGQIAIGFYIDDIPWIGGGPFGPPVRLFDLESLEVLRGPQGTLYGQGSMGGTFVMKTSRPDMENFTARGKTWGSDMEDADESYGADWTVSAPIIKDQLALRVTGGFANHTGIAESPDFDDENIDDFDQRDIRAKLRWEPTDTLAATLTYWHTQEDRNFSPGIWATVDPPIIAGTGGVVGDVEQETQFVSLLLDWESPFGHLTSATGYINNEGVFDSAFAFQTPDQNGNLLTNVLQLTVPAQTKNWNQEIRLTSTSDGRLQWIVGGTMTEQNGDNSTLSAFKSGPLFGLVPDSVSVNDGFSRSWSVFGEMSYELFDGKLTPLVGLRYFEDEVDANSVFVGFPPQAPLHVDDKTFDAWSPRFNLKYQPNDESQIYLNVAKGFRSGVFNTPNQIVTSASLGITVTEELPESTLWSYEIGGRFDLFDNTLRIEPAIYYVDYKDYQFEGSVGNINFDLQIDEVEGVGADLLVTYVPPIEGLVLSFIADYNETEPTDLQEGVTLSVNALEEDEQLPFVPKWGYTIQADYEHPLPFAGLTGFGTISWYERGSQVDFITALKSENPVNLTVRAGVRSDNWSLSLWSENLTDDHGPAVIAGGLENRYDRRQIGITLTANFDGGAM
jgi:outer membrane receptor protein involved in Fe transport